MSDNQASRWNVDHNAGDDRFVRLRLKKIGWVRTRVERDVPPATAIDMIIPKKSRPASGTPRS